MTTPRKPATKPDPKSERLREVGQREETLKRALEEDEVTTLRIELEGLLDEEERIEEKKKEAAKNFSSQLETNRLQMSDLRRRIKARVVEEKVLVKEFLTKSNEIVRVRADTDEPIGVRTATKAELQEELFPEKPNAASPGNGGPQNDAQPAGLEFGGDAA